MGVCDGWCGWHVWFVGGVVCWLCFAWLAHPITLSTHQTTTTLPFFSPFTTPIFFLSFCVCGKGGGPESGWCGMECGIWHATHQPLCFHQAITNPCVSLVLHHSLLTLKLLLFFHPSLFVCLVCFDRKSEGQVWDSPCQTHCAPHPIHTTLFPSNHPPFSMSTWLIGL